MYNCCKEATFHGKDRNLLIPRIRIPRKKLAEFCKRNHILKLSLFGSILHDSLNPKSDIDAFVEFEPEHVPGFALIRMQNELSTILGGRKVDLVTPISRNTNPVAQDRIS